MVFRREDLLEKHRHPEFVLVRLRVFGLACLSLSMTILW